MAKIVSRFLKASFSFVNQIFSTNNENETINQDFGNSSIYDKDPEQLAHPGAQDFANASLCEKGPEQLAHLRAQDFANASLYDKYPEQLAHPGAQDFANASLYGKGPEQLAHPVPKISVMRPYMTKI